MFKPTLKKKTSINIIPMIDVIFFLLVFFMLFTSFRTNPQGIEMQLPKAVTVTEQASENFVVEINQEGQFFHNGENMELTKIVNLAQGNNEKNQLVVIISADKKTRYEYVVTLMDGLRQAGIYKLALAAEKEES